MAALNTSANGPSISASYQKIVNAPAPSAPSPTHGQWALFTVQAPLASAFQPDAGKESVLKVQTTGEGELADLLEDFSDGRIQFGFVKVKDPNTGLPKNVLIAWCGEGVPERTKGYFTSHLNVVSKILHGYHVQVTARSESDLTPDGIVQKVADASGSKYSGGGGGAAVSDAGRPPPPVASKPAMPTKSFGTSSFQPLSQRSRQAPAQRTAEDADGWGEDAPPVTRSQLEKVASAYQPTKVNMGQLQSQTEPSRYQAPQSTSNGGDVVKGGYQPVGKVDLAAIRREAQQTDATNDDRPTVVKGAYEPVGKVDINEIRRKAQGAPPPAQPSPPPAPAQGEEERPKSLAERSAAFSAGGNDGRLTSMPKPQVANRFGSQASTFTGTKAPAPGGFESKPIAPSAPIGVAGKNFADAGGKTPAQQWEERRRARGLSGAGDTPSPSAGAPASPIQSQTSGAWQSGYGGKKWGVQIPTRTGGSGVSAQGTGDDVNENSPPEQASPEPEQSPPTGNVGSIRDRFKDSTPMGAQQAGAASAGGAPAPPPLDTTSKPNAGARGVPMPGLPQRPADDDDNEDDEEAEPHAESHHTLPPPPPRPMPDADEEEKEIQDDYSPQGSPPRIAMPVARNAPPSPEPAVPQTSLENALAAHRDPSPEPQVEASDPARGAGQQAATATFGAAEDTRGAGAGKEAVALYDYEKAEENELELREGERVSGIEMVDEDWWMGANARGETGLFPSNYVELVEDGGQGAEAEPTPQQESGTSSPPPPPPPAPAAASAPTAQGKTAVAQFDYEAAEDNELSFPDGATIEEIEFPDEDWWFGHYGGKSGLFPANYVEMNN
ncbi:hypothetical protein B0A50_01857 [Salinomyces thailandicus]|uniref:Actin binding protein n=1 Tax=Salinomyces thailandicus TaxID=706561 RepID=A0A4U0U994_9PEZI|nr:hypothetical protein B0A50_01857 [Salinomyces thailandica]